MNPDDSIQPEANERFGNDSNGEPQHDHSREPYTSDPGARAGMLNEALLCDLIEHRLSPSKEKIARDLLSRDPHVEAVIAQIAHDRDVLSSIGDEACPPEVADQALANVIAQLERGVLTGSDLATGLSEPMVEGLRPASEVIVKTRASEHRLKMLLAAAAGLVVVTGAVVGMQYVLQTLQQPAAPVSPRFAQDTPAEPDLSAEVDPVQQVATDTELAEVPSPTLAEPPLMQRPVEALRLAQAGRAELQFVSADADAARTALASLPARTEHWRLEGLRSGGPIFCMVAPRAESWSVMATAFEAAGLRTRLIEIEPARPAATTLEPQRLLWWEHRSTWAVPDARVPIRFVTE